MKKKFLEITDPIHDFIRLNNTEQKIIDTPVFQRLRRIKQLSGAHLTYPGAQHTRFEHSLGVMHIAGMAANSLSSKGQMPAADTDDIDWQPYYTISGMDHSHTCLKKYCRKKRT